MTNKGLALTERAARKYARRYWIELIRAYCCESIGIPDDEVTPMILEIWRNEGECCANRIARVDKAPELLSPFREHK